MPKSKGIASVPFSILVSFSLVSLFKGMLTIVGYLMPKSSL